MFGTRLPNGIKLDSSAHCWNENCKEVIPMLQELVAGAPIDLPALELPKPPSLEEIRDESFKRYKRLNSTQSLASLPPNHPALAYLESREFDPAVYGSVLGLSFCSSDDGDLRLAKDRLIIPVVFGGVPVGWQARAITGFTRIQKPKYWTSPGCSKSWFVYNYDWASTFSGVVIAEGPTDVWRIGPAGVAILGRRLSKWQVNLIGSTWGDKAGPVILYGDPGFEDDWSKNLRDVQKELNDPNRAILIISDKDPGDSTFEAIWERIKYECRILGFGPSSAEALRRTWDSVRRA
jgi:hypothetical protein